MLVNSAAAERGDGVPRGGTASSEWDGILRRRSSPSNNSRTSSRKSNRHVDTFSVMLRVMDIRQQKDNLAI